MSLHTFFDNTFAPGSLWELRYTDPYVLDVFWKFVDTSQTMGELESRIINFCFNEHTPPAWVFSVMHDSDSEEIPMSFKEFQYQLIDALHIVQNVLQKVGSGG